MSRLIHGAAALTLIVLAAACLLGFAGGGPAGAETGASAGAANSACQNVLCMFAIS
jgi:hypothetical protein